MKLKHIARALPLLAAFGLGAASCTDIDSSLVEFEEDNKISSPTDTVYSLVGILNKLQAVADRTILLGELRGELTSLTPQASTQLQEIAGFTAGTDNDYNVPSDYYAVIQNCNFFIARADTSLSKRGEKVFIREYAAVKAIRAWTYLQLAIHYGQVPFVTKPILTEKDGTPSLYEKKDIAGLCEYFINDLAPYADTQLPSLGSMNGISSAKFFYPVRVLLGDMCLWSGRYADAAKYYHDYLTLQNNIHTTGTNAATWASYKFESISSSYGQLFSTGSQEVVAVIPMATSLYDGTISYLPDVFTSTAENNYYFQATSSAALTELSRSQRYTLVYTDPATQLPDTVSPSADLIFDNANKRGDLRLYSVLTQRAIATGSKNDNTVSQSLGKYSYDRSSNDGRVTIQNIPTLRIGTVYLRYAEALNRAGYPQSAFAVLKHGLWSQNIEKYISADERAKAGDLISFSQYTFLRSNTQGIHSRGCGSADADTTYAIPSPTTYVAELEGHVATAADSILYVENRIVDEMALEETFEGIRFADLQRVALRRGDPTFLARKIAGREGKDAFDDGLFARLSDKKNWYLPLP